MEGYPWFHPGEDGRNLEGGWGRDDRVTCVRIAPLGTLVPLRDLILTWGDIPMSTWRYFQIADFSNERKSLIRPLNTLTTFESWCIENQETKHLLYKMYKLILKTQNISTPYYIKEWEREIGQRFSTLQIQKMD